MLKTLNTQWASDNEENERDDIFMIPVKSSKSSKHYSISSNTEEDEETSE